MRAPSMSDLNFATAPSPGDNSDNLSQIVVDNSDTLSYCRLMSDGRRANSPQSRAVTETELAVLRQLWKRGPSTIRELTETLYPAGGASAHATVQKLLERLAAKDCVSRRKDGRANVYTAEVRRRDLIGRRLQEVADTFCDGALSPLLTHLVHSSELTEEDVSALRKLVDDLDSEAKDEGAS